MAAAGAASPSCPFSRIALLSGAHEGNTAAVAAAEWTSLAPDDIRAKASQDATSVSCPGSAVAVFDIFVYPRRVVGCGESGGSPAQQVSGAPPPPPPTTALRFTPARPRYPVDGRAGPGRATPGPT